MAANITPPRPTAKGKGPHHYVPNQASSAGPTSSSSSTAGRSGSTATSLAMTPAEMNDHMGVNIPEAFYSPQAPAALRPTELPGRVGVTVLGLEKREDALQSSVRELVELGASPSRSSSFNNSRQGGGGALSTASTATSREHEEHHQKMRQEYYNEQNVAAPDSSAAKKLKKKKNYISRTQTYPGGPRGPPGAQAYLHSTSTPPPGGTASGRSSGVAQSAPRGGGVNRAYSPEFYENESNMKTVFSYHGIRVDGGQQSLFPDTPDGASSSSAGGLGRATQQEQTQRTERSLFFVVLGFVAVSVGIGILVLWCDLVHDETHSKNLHNYTGWCHAGLIDYIPRYFYASYSVFTITILAIFLSQHPSVRRGIREFKDAVRTNCFPHRYRALDEQESTYTMAASPWMNFQPGRHTSAAFETPIPTPLVPPGGLRQDMQQTRGRTETGRGTSSRIKKVLSLFDLVVSLYNDASSKENYIERLISANRKASRYKAT
ncbi:unnamed protein product [Amoebophrya sp. A25]|nr:unnamed protein product [Amoebophrya sp. A25]|eukprot:GSA25T00017374001.1